MTIRSRRARLGAAVVAVALAATACGGDDDTDTASPTPTDTSAPGDDAAGEVDVAAFCDNWSQLQATVGDVPPEQTVALAEAAAAASPEEVAESIETQVRLFTEQGDGATEDPEFVAAEAIIDEYMFDECEADTTIEFNAVDYAYTDAPTEVAAGTVKLRLANEGTELHEAIHLVKKDGVTESWQQILSLPEEEAMSKVDFVGAGFAMPGGADVGIHQFDAGEHAFVCFIPVGSTPEAMEGGEQTEGPPHFTQGMIHEFVVS